MDGGSRTGGEGQKISLKKLAITNDLTEVKESTNAFWRGDLTVGRLLLELAHQHQQRGDVDNELEEAIQRSEDVGRHGMIRGGSELPLHSGGTTLATSVERSD